MGSYLAIGEFPLRIVPTKMGAEGFADFLFCVKHRKHTKPCTTQAKPLYTLCEPPELAVLSAVRKQKNQA